MKQTVNPKHLKLLTGAAGVLGCMFRAALYAGGVDRKGLLITGHWSSIGVWLLTAAVAAVMLLRCRLLTGPTDYETAFPSSVFSAAGAVLAAVAFVLSPIGQLPSPALVTMEPVLRFAAAGSLILIGYCRYRGRKPFFLLHCTVCLYLALRLICQYRIWSVDPQIQNYVFYLGAHVALMITAYQLAAFDAGCGNHRNLWAAGLSGIYLSIVSLPGSDDPFFLICCILWIFGNLSHPATGKWPISDRNHTTQED